MPSNLRRESIILFCLAILVFYPGAMSIDSYSQLGQARINWYNDWHPPVMAVIWHYLEKVATGPFPMLVAQLALVLGGLALIAGALPVRRPWLKSAFLAAVFLFPPTLGILGNIWKDIWMAGWLLLGIGLLLRFPKSWTALAGAAGCLFLAVLFRHNGIVPVGLIAIWILFARLPIQSAARKGIVATALAIPLTLGIGAGAQLTNHLLTNVKLPYIQQILLYDLVGVTVRSGDMRFLREAITPDIGIYRKGDVTLELLQSKYVPSTWTPLVFEADSPYKLGEDEASKSRLIPAWKEAITTYPLAYLEHRWAVFKQVIGLHNQGLFAPVYFGIPGDSPDTGIFEKLKLRNFNAEMSPFQYWVRDRLTELSATVFYRPWLWLAILILLTAVYGLLFRDHHWLLVLLLTGLANELVLFLTAPSADYRYSLWTILATWIVFLAMTSIAADRGTVARASKPTASVAAFLFFIRRLAVTLYRSARFHIENLVSSKYWTKLAPAFELIRARPNASLIVLLALAAICLHYPGQVSVDTVIQMQDGLSRVYDSNQPPAMSLYLSTLGLPGMLLLNVGTFSLAAAFLLHNAASRPGKQKAAIAFLFLSPVALVYIGILWKDVLFAHLTLLSFLILNNRLPLNWKSLAISAALFSLAASVRQQGILVAVVFVTYMFLSADQQRPLATRLKYPLLWALIFFTASAAIKGTIEASGDTSKSSSTIGPILQLAQFDLGGIASKNPDLDFTAIENAGSAFPAERRPTKEKIWSALSHYSPQRQDLIGNSPAASTFWWPHDSLLEEWKRNIATHPVDYFQHRIDVLSWILGLHDIGKCVPYYSGITSEPAKMVTETNIEPGMSGRARLIKKIGKTTHFLFRPIIYIILSIAIVALLSIRGWRKHALMISIQAAGLGYAASYLFVGIACDIRYTYFSTLAAIFGIGYLLTIGNQHNQALEQQRTP